MLYNISYTIDILDCVNRTKNGSIIPCWNKNDHIDHVYSTSVNRPHKIGAMAAGLTSMQADFGDKDDCPVSSRLVEHKMHENFAVHVQMNIIVFINNNRSEAD